MCNVESLGCMSEQRSDSGVTSFAFKLHIGQGGKLSASGRWGRVLLNLIFVDDR